MVNPFLNSNCMLTEMYGNIHSLDKELTAVVAAKVQGCNCFCLQGAGLAKQFAQKYDTLNPSKFLLEGPQHKGSLRKYGHLEWWHPDYGKEIRILKPGDDPYIVNAYTQYQPGRNASYHAVGTVFEKLNHIFAGQTILLPEIGCGIGGLDFDIVREMAGDIFTSTDAIFVHYVQG